MIGFRKALCLFFIFCTVCCVSDASSISSVEYVITEIGSQNIVNRLAVEQKGSKYFIKKESFIEAVQEGNVDVAFEITEKQYLAVKRQLSVYDNVRQLNGKKPDSGENKKISVKVRLEEGDEVFEAEGSPDVGNEQNFFNSLQQDFNKISFALAGIAQAQKIDLSPKFSSQESRTAYLETMIRIKTENIK